MEIYIRKMNAISAALSMILFVAHMIWGGLELAGMTAGGNAVFTGLTHLLLTAVCLHMALSVVLTARTVRALAKSKKPYFRENRLFWIRRISGLALMLFIMVHALIFMGDGSSGTYRLNMFGAVQLASQILMVLSLLIHLCCNITPLRISFGIEDRKKMRVDIILVLSIILFLAGLAMVVYFLRWRVI
ncbi:MAG: hypothetical protein J6E32_10100 [Lachnospiraceae bacterium]|nr:hypothetical protein [Lachnospiraceae bacterium]